MAHDWVSDPALAAAFQAFPGVSFIVNGVTPPSDLALVSVGAEMRYASGWSLAAKFDGEFAGHTNTYAGSAPVRYTHGSRKNNLASPLLDAIRPLAGVH